MVSSGILAIFVLLFRCVQRPDLNIERRVIKRDGKHRGIAEGKWIFSFLYKWVINHLSFTYSLTITHAIFLLMWQRNNYRWKMACLFILYTDLVPHLHDLKNDVSSCPAKRELAAQDVSAWDYGKDCWDEQQGNNQSLVPCFFFARNGLQWVSPGLGRGAPAWSWCFSLVVLGYLPMLGFQKVLCGGTANKNRSALYTFPFKQVKCGEQK